MNLPTDIEFDRKLCGDLNAASQLEWLVTNGIGGYASGTIAGILTRRYHGLLVAALQPPGGRTLLVAKLEDAVQVNGQWFALSANSWVGGAVDPQGFQHLEHFRLEGTTPVWRFTCGKAQLEKRVWMQQDENTTFVRYTYQMGTTPITLQAKALVNYRDFHSTTHANGWQMDVQRTPAGLCVTAFAGATPIYIVCEQVARGLASCDPAADWYRNFYLARERDRGLDDHEDHLHVGDITFTLQPGESVTLVMSTQGSRTSSADRRNGAAAWQLHQAFEVGVLQSSQTTGLLNVVPGGANPPTWIRQLALAAAQFMVKRPLKDDPDALSVIAGYHWFGDWGRDTMIALPGLTLAAGRAPLAAKILRTFAKFVDRGMLPNYFPDTGHVPEYNTVDASLWYFEAVRQYFAATADRSVLAELFPVLAGIVDWHLRGTRYSIQVDAADGLLFAGEPGVQLTWMDAKVGDWVVTPRIGKPVEINALWYNALCTMAGFADALGFEATRYQRLANQVRASFIRFWNPETNYCWDVIDGPASPSRADAADPKGADPAIRPNAIFAVSLPQSPLTAEQQAAVVARCQQDLLTPFGLRSLSPNDPQYQGHYGGSPAERDGAYHQGTVWGWLLGPFALAHFKVHCDRAAALAMLSSIAPPMRSLCAGTLPEIFDGDPPHLPCGAVAQAWTVAEVLRAYAELSGSPLAAYDPTS